MTYSSFGARCVNSLSSKLLLALFPARQSFFRLGVSTALKQQMGGDKMEAEIQKALSSVEREVMDDINASPVRTPAGEAVKHLLVAGNVLTHLMPEGGLKVYPLDSYVVQRDAAGNPMVIVVEERMALSALPEAVRSVVQARVASRLNDKSKADITEVYLYTSITRGILHWSVQQECEGLAIPSSRGTYPLDACPWFPLRWIPDQGGDYGRGLVEDYLGHLISLESLTASLVKGTAVAAKVLFLRNPNAVTKASKVTQAETGSVIDGKSDDIVPLQVGKQADFATAKELIRDIKEELAYAFVLNQAVQRNAERVTAEEIRFMAQELDTTLGGNYSTLAMDFQLPFLTVKMAQMQRKGKLPMLPKGSIRPIIVTGLDALGRGADLDNLKALVKDVVDLGGPEALETFMNFDDLLTRLATARGVTTEGLIKDRQQVAQEQEQKKQMQLMQQLGPQAINAMGGLAKQGIATAGQPTQ